MPRFVRDHVFSHGAAVCIDTGRPDCVILWTYLDKRGRGAPSMSSREEAESQRTPEKGAGAEAAGSNPPLGPHRQVRDCPFSIAG